MSFSRLAQCSPFTMHSASVLFSVCFLLLLFFGTCLSFGKFAFSVSTANFVVVVTLKVCSVYYYQFLSHLSMLFFFFFSFLFFFSFRSDIRLVDRRLSCLFKA